MQAQARLLVRITAQTAVEMPSMTTPILVRVTTPSGDEIAIPYHDLGPATRAPRLVLVAGLRGNELNSTFVLSRLADFLTSIEAGERPGKHLQERVLIVPTVNSLALNPGTLIASADADNVGLGQRFRDSLAQEAAPSVAEALQQLTRQAYYRVDVQTSNGDIEEMPQVWLYEPNDDERATACLFGLPAIVERADQALAASRLIHAWRGYGGENFILETGQAGQLQTFHCETLFHALVAFLDRTGIVSGLTLSEEEENLRYFSSDQTFALHCEKTGFFVSRLEVGRWIYGGDHIGHIYDTFTGMVHTEVRAPVSGLLSSLRRQPMLIEGDLMARILMPGKANIISKSE